MSVRTLFSLLIAASVAACTAGPAKDDPTDTDVIPTDTDVIPSDTDVEPTETDVEPTETDVEPTDVEPTDSDVDPSDTDVAPTDVDPSDTDVAPTDVDPTDSDVAPTDVDPTDVDPTETDVEPTDTGEPADTIGLPEDTGDLTDVASDSDVAPTDTDVDPTTDTDVDPTETDLTDADVAPTDTDVAPTDTDVAPTDTDLEPTDTDVEPSDLVTDPSDGATDVAPDTGDTAISDGPSDVIPVDTADSDPLTDTGALGSDSGAPLPSDVPEDTWADALSDTAEIIIDPPDTSTPVVSFDATIADVSRGTIPEGALVRVQDVVVTATTGYGFYAQQGGGQWNGTFVYAPNQPNARLLQVGDVVDVAGYTQVFNGGWQIAALDGPWLVERTANPQRLALSATDLVDPSSREGLHGVLVMLDDLAVTSTVLAGGEYETNSGLVLDNRLFNIPASYLPGDRFDAVTAIVNYSLTYKLNPRSASDIEGFIPAPGGFDRATPPFIVEVLDHAQIPNVKYVEIFNPWPAAIGLRGLELVRFANGSVFPSDAFPLPDTLVEAGGTFVIINEPGLADFLTLYGDIPGVTAPAVNGNGNDAYALRVGGEIVDVFGEVGVDGAGTAWDYTDLVAKRAPGVLAPRATFDIAEWIVVPTTEAAPGSRD